MNRSLRHFRHTMDVAVRRTAGRQPSLEIAVDPPTSDLPQLYEVLGEIGLILAVHLAVALAITLTLRVFGIA